VRGVPDTLSVYAERIAAPMVGGVLTSVVVVLLVYPCIYYIWKGWGLKESADAADSTG